MKTLVAIASALLVTTASPALADGRGSGRPAIGGPQQFRPAVASIRLWQFFGQQHNFWPGRHWGWFKGRHWGWFKPHHPHWPHEPPKSP